MGDSGVPAFLICTYDRSGELDERASRTRYDTAHTHCPKDEDGKPIKYRSRSGVGSVIYAPKPDSFARFATATEKHIAEGEFKTITLDRRGFPVLGIGGVWNWRKDGELHPDLAARIHRGDVVYVWIDGDWSTNPDVNAGALRLMEAIRALGATPKLPMLNPDHGIDDHLVQFSGDASEELKRLMASAITSIRDYERERAKRIGAGDSSEGPALSPAMTLMQMLEDYIYLADTDEVCCIRAPRIAHPPARFANLMKASRTPIGETQRATTNLWMASESRKQIPARTWHPGTGVFTVNPDGVAALNIWRPRPPPSSSVGSPDLFLRHLEFLVPNETERNRFIDWMAHIQQRPGEQVHSHYLLVAPGAQGIGRNWLACLLARVWRGEVALAVNLADVLAGKFNQELSQKTLAVVDELHEVGTVGSSWSKAENLKSELTRTHRKIKPKYGKEHIEFNCTRWLMFSNHRDALPLTEEDRRMWVVENPSVPREPEYYARLYIALEDESFINAVRSFLHARDISAFKAGERPTLNEAKRQMIASTKNDEEELLRNVIATWPADCILRARLIAEIWGPDGLVNETELRHRGAHLKRMLVRVGAENYPKKIPYGRGQERATILRNTGSWMAKTPHEVAEEVMRGEPKERF